MSKRDWWGDLKIAPCISSVDCCAGFGLATPGVPQAGPGGAAVACAQHPADFEEQIGGGAPFTERSPAVADRVIDATEIAEFISEVTHHDAGRKEHLTGGGILAAAS